ncbi:hypothetical protein JCM10908_003286 [Rhodotorula pacifica]|uniref:CDP-diacylglycerol--glycerol-3-phosphate 3-phosphatidyltransferase n=1 Tax=Rhodotorula pacifica TaxID=1495444 RepID=UPI003171F012
MLARAATAPNRARRVSLLSPTVHSWIRSCPYTTTTTRRPSERQRGPAPEFERHPAFKQLDRDLDEGGVPCFPARGEQVSVLQDPQQFYNTLLDKIRNAKRRIFIASLYVGKEEKKLVQTLHQALRANPNLQLTVLVDYLRSTRELPSSASLLASLAAAFPKQVDLRLFHTPELNGWRRRLVPKRFNEGWGLQHMKCYGFDDDVIMSGANLSHDYFTNRTDRYIEFRSHPPLADFFHSLLEITGSYSFRVTASDTSTLYPSVNITWPTSGGGGSGVGPNRVPENPFEGSPSSAIPAFKEHAHDSLAAFLKEWHRKDPLALASALPPASSSPPPSSSSRRDMRSSTTPTRSSSRLHASPLAAFDTRLRPILQMGPFNLTAETDLVVPRIFSTANAFATAPGGNRTVLDWTSGYFGLREDYKRLALQCKAKVRIVSASPEANGFFNSRGVSRFIPPAYTYFTEQFYNEIEREAERKSRRSDGSAGDKAIELREWRREGWTYHAKGIWLAPSVFNPLSPPAPSSTSTTLTVDPHVDEFSLRYSHPSPPFLTLIGSSNFGSRSAARDLEAGVLVTTQNSTLRWALENEVRLIRKFADVLVERSLFQKPDRKVPWGVRVAASAIETML